jgi:parvulin-like peptidyl-prolyl isomerase
MKQRTVLISTVCVLILGLAGCDKIKNLLGSTKPSVKSGEQYAVKGTVIARINNLPITLEELNKEIDLYNASIDYTQLPDEEKKKAKIDTREKKLDYLKNVMIRQRMFYQAALDRGLDRRDDIEEILQRDKIAILAGEMQREIINSLDVTPAEIEDAYKSIKEQLKEPESRKIREIAVASEADAKQILIELLQGGDFASIAKSRSIAASKDNSGDLGYITRGKLGEKYAAFDEAAFSNSLGQGAISNVFKGPEGNYYIIKVENIKEGKQLSKDEVSDRIKELLMSRKQKESLDKAYADISGKSKLEIYEGEIK